MPLLKNTRRRRRHLFFSKQPVIASKSTYRSTLTAIPADHVDAPKILLYQTSGQRSLSQLDVVCARGASGLRMAGVC
jgi:hypothetical protein